MKTRKLAAIVAIAAVAIASATFVALAPAEADPITTKKKPAVAYQRPSTRITVKRPFTDPGTETKPLDEHYHDYAFSPTYTPYPNQGGIVGFWRSPLPSPVDMPGTWNFGF